MQYKFFEIEIKEKVALVNFNNNEKKNALNWHFWEELPKLVDEIESNEAVNVILFYSKSKNFSIGLDIFDFGEKFKELIFKKDQDKLYELIKKMQKGMNKIEQSSKIYISAVNGYCIGGALDFVATCDLRFCSKDTVFSLRETKLGIVADMGSLQRLPYIIGYGNLKYLAFTGKDFDANKAYEISLVSEVFENDELFENVLKIAKEISENPFDAVSGTKKIINNMISDDIQKSLEEVALHNKENLDFMKVVANLSKSLSGGK